MAAGNIFDQWRKYGFFSAAEEVQGSADRLQSVYRMWKRDIRDRFGSKIPDESLIRELHTALGTAKWQLEEFESAVNSSHEKCSVDENAVTMHREFIAAIGHQIFHIEKAISDSLSNEGKQPLCWVQLDKEERDDLAIFLSAEPQSLDETIDHVIDPLPEKTLPKFVSGFKETASLNMDSKCVVELSTKETFRSKVEVIAEEDDLDRQRKKYSSPDLSAWKIVIDDGKHEDRKPVETRNYPSSPFGFMRSVGYTTKSKWFRNKNQKAKCGKHPQFRKDLSHFLHLKGITRFTKGINGLSERSRSCFINHNEEPIISSVPQLLRKAKGLLPKVHDSHYYVQVGCSFQVSILLLLTIILIVPFVLYST